MDSSSGAVEQSWQSLMIDRATSDEDKFTPLHKLEEVCELLRTSNPTIVQQLSELLLNRLHHDSPIVKSKSLRLIKYAVVKSGEEFRREMQRNSSEVVSQLVHYNGLHDPLKGDALNKAVRDTARETLSAIFSSHDNYKPVKSPHLDYSHFISIPLAMFPELVDKLVKFRNSILGFSDLNTENDASYPSEASNSSYTDGMKPSSLFDLGIERSLFIDPKTFHLTLLVLKLWNKEQVDVAVQVLKSVRSKVLNALESQPVSIRLKGLDCMKGSPAKAWIVYAPVEEVGAEGRFLHACQAIIDAYVEAGLVLEKDAKRSLKLHATVMNSAKRNSKGKTGKREPFDARGIFERFGCFDWGEYFISEARLSEMDARDEDGYYRSHASICFPQLK